MCDQIDRGGGEEGVIQRTQIVGGSLAVGSRHQPASAPVHQAWLVGPRCRGKGGDFDLLNRETITYALIYFM